MNILERVQETLNRVDLEQISMRKLAADIGIDQGRLSKIRHGDATPSYAELTAIATYFGMQLGRPTKNKKLLT